MFAICVLGAVTWLILWAIQLSAPPALFDLVQALGWGLALPVVFSIMAALVINRQPGNRLGWLMMGLRSTLTIKYASRASALRESKATDC